MTHLLWPWPFKVTQGQGHLQGCNKNVQFMFNIQSMDWALTFPLSHPWPWPFKVTWTWHKERCFPPLLTSQVSCFWHFNSVRNNSIFRENVIFACFHHLLWPWPLNKVPEIYTFQKAMVSSAIVLSLGFVLYILCQQDFLWIKIETFWPFQMLLWPWPSRKITQTLSLELPKQWG